MKSFRIDKVVGVEEGYRTEVDLGTEIANDDENQTRLNGYIPTKPAIEALKKFGKAMQPNWAQRAHFLTGQYGSGKSHFGLVLANLFRLSADDKTLNHFIRRLELKDKDAAKAFVQARWHGNVSDPFLVVLPDPQRPGFGMALLAALEKALKDARIEFKFTTYYQEALKKLDELLRDPELEKRIKNHLAERQITVRVLRAELEGYKDEGFRTFLEIVKSATTMEFIPNAQADAGTVFREAAKLVRQNGFAGILVIADEFGTHLTELAKHGQAPESLAIQSFAEACNNSRADQIHFVAIAHKTLADYKSFASDKQDWDKVAGRFSDHSLDYAQGQEEEIVDLIGAFLVHKDNTETQNAYWKEVTNCIVPVDDWVRNAGLYPGMDKNWRHNRLIAGCFPLHPATVFCLPWLALRVAQRERTAIRFLSSDEDGSLVKFMATHTALYEDKALNLYTPERLLDFFGKSVRQHEEHSAVMRAYDEAFARCGGEEVANRIIKLIAVLTIVKQPALQTTAENISSILGRTAKERIEIGKMLDELDSQGYILLHEPSGRYELPRRGDGDLTPQDAIKQIRAQWTPRDFDVIKEIARLRDTVSIMASEYEAEKALPRSAKVDFVSADHLSNLAASEETIKSWYAPGNTNYQGDALLWYVVAIQKDEISKADSALIKGTKSNQHIVAVPKLPFTSLEELRDLAAIRDLKEKRGGKIGERVVDAHALNRLKETIERQVQEATEEYFRASNFQWHYGKNKRVEIKDGAETEFLTNLFLDVFPDTPKVQDQAVGLKPTGALNSHRKAAITKLIEVRGGPLQVENSGGAPANRILRSVLYKTELFGKVKDLGLEIEIEIQKKVPTRSVLSKVWNLIDTQLAQENEGIHFDSLVRLLLEPPYGLPAALIEVLIAAYMRYRRGNFQIYDNAGEAHPPSAALVESIVRGRADYVLTYYEFHPAEEDWLKGIIALMSTASLPDIGLIEQARDSLLAWIEGLPAGTREARDHDPRIAAILALTNNEKQKADAKNLLFAELPKALGFSEKEEAQPKVKEMIAALRECKNIADIYVQRRGQQAVELLCRVFAVGGASLEDLIGGMRSWWSQLRADQRMHGYEPDIQALVVFLSKGGLNEDGLLVDLPKKMSCSAYTEWADDKDMDMFIRQVKNAKRMIETHGGKLVPAGPVDPAEDKLAPKEVRGQILGILERSGMELAERIKLLQSLLNELKK